MKKIYLTLVIASALLFSACEDWVNEVDPLIDQVEDDLLTNESQVPFLINGVKGAFARAQGYISVDGEGMSDAFVFDTDNPSATYTASYGMIDEGTIYPDNTEVETIWQYVGELRNVSDNLLERCQKINFTDADLHQEAIFVANFYGGIARYYYALYFGKDNTTIGGGCIAGGAFIESSQMMTYALQKFEAALANAPTDYETRMVHSVMARANLFMGNYAEAATHASAGMIEGDNPYQAIYNNLEQNYFYYFAGLGRPQWTVNSRYADYITQDSTEALRISLSSKAGTSGKTHYIQTKYAATTAPITFMSWQENYLMRAELTVRGNGSGDAVVLVNAVRNSHTANGQHITPITAANLTLDDIYVERDKELFATGVRFVDQKRFNRWNHLPSGTDVYLPIPESELNANDNF